MTDQPETSETTPESNGRRGHGIRNTLSAKAKRRVYRTLETVTEEVEEDVVRYKTDSDGNQWTDESVAAWLGLAEHHVRYVRAEAFGKLYEPEPEPAPVAEEDRIAALATLIVDLAATIADQNERIKMLVKSHDGLDAALTGAFERIAALERFKEAFRVDTKPGEQIQLPGLSVKPVVGSP